MRALVNGRSPSGSCCGLDAGRTGKVWTLFTALNPRSCFAVLGAFGGPFQSTLGSSPPAPKKPCSPGDGDRLFRAACPLKQRLQERRREWPKVRGAAPHLDVCRNRIRGTEKYMGWGMAPLDSRRIGSGLGSAIRSAACQVKRVQ